MREAPAEAGTMYVAIVRDLTESKENAAKLEALHHEVLETSRHAGMAQVATNILHNVGNVLNSINVSAALATDAVRDLRVEGVARAGEALRERPDPAKVAKLGVYLGRLAAQMEQRRTSVVERAPGSARTSST